MSYTMKSFSKTNKRNLIMSSVLLVTHSGHDVCSSLPKAVVCACLWDGAYKITLAANRYLSGPLPYA